MNETPSRTEQEVLSIIEKSRKAQCLWAGLSIKERAKKIKRVAKLLASKSEELSTLIARVSGKTRIDALATEILTAAMAVPYYCKHAKKFIKPKKIDSGSFIMFNKRSSLHYEPYGVVGIISPWNYPFAIPFSEVIMALLAGNGVILKVASNSEAIGEALYSLFEDSQLPQDLFSHVCLTGEEAGNAFLSGGIDKLFFTGSTRVGKKLMAKASENLVPLVLELGGADAAIVCADADLDRAVRGLVWAGYANAGQSCGGVQRILIHEDVYPNFIKKMSLAIKALQIGDPLDHKTDIGAMNSIRQKKAVIEQLDECIKSGLRIEAQSDGGNLSLEDPYMPAILLTGNGPQAPILTDEVFGPILVAQAYTTIEDAIKEANNSPYGLTGSVWSKNTSKAKKIALQIQAGPITINDHLMSHGLAETPWGGYKNSGLGRSHGELGFMEMLIQKVIVTDCMPYVQRNIFWHPYSENLFKGLKNLIYFLQGPELWKKIKAIPSVLRLFVRYWDRKN